MQVLDNRQMIIVRKFVDAVAMRMEAGDLDLDEGMAVIRTAICRFDPGEHAHALAFMKDVSSAEAE